jgi:transposase InsO family protein
MIGRAHTLPVKRQAKELGISRGSVYYLPRPVSSENLAIAISMDGRGAWRDNVVVERLWRSVKYEEVYLHAYASVSEARNAIGRYLGFYNARRPHSSLGGRPPDQTYFDNLPQAVAA